MLAVVIPTLNAAAGLPGALASLGPGRVRIAEVVVADGGSTDGTQAAAEAGGARVVKAPRGRGSQLRASVAATTAPLLLVLHADSRLGPGWPEALPEDGRAGWFRLRLDDPAPAARRVEQLANWRARRLALPYGDQGLETALPSTTSKHARARTAPQVQPTSLRPQSKIRTRYSDDFSDRQNA